MLSNFYGSRCTLGGDELQVETEGLILLSRNIWVKSRESLEQYSHDFLPNSAKHAFYNTYL